MSMAERPSWIPCFHSKFKEAKCPVVQHERTYYKAFKLTVLALFSSSLFASQMLMAPLRSASRE